MGAAVDVVPAYETRKPVERKSGKVRKMLAGNIIDAVTFTSSSTVKNFLAIFPEFVRLPQTPIIACIGPITADTLREAGCRARIVAREFTIEKLAQDMEDYFFKRKGRRKS
jgi:uroporphyrinogen III methyltransferase/synthase